MERAAGSSGTTLYADDADEGVSAERTAHSGAQLLGLDSAPSGAAHPGIVTHTYRPVPGTAARQPDQARTSGTASAKAHAGVSRPSDQRASDGRIALVSVGGSRAQEHTRAAPASADARPSARSAAGSSGRANPPSPATAPHDTPDTQQTPAPPRISLDQVLTRQTPVQWHEAVAIVERTCAALIEEDGHELPPPELSGVRIGADGTLSVERGSRGEPGVARLGRMLYSLTPASSTPPRLRLFISQWMAATEASPLRDLASDLAYFARPNPEALIRAVYERYLARPAVAGPIATQQAPAADDQPNHAPLRTALVVAAVAASLIAGIFVWFLVSSNVGSPPAVADGVDLDVDVDTAPGAQSVDPELMGATPTSAMAVVDPDPARPPSPLTNAVGSPPRADAGTGRATDPVNSAADSRAQTTGAAGLPPVVGGAGASDGIDRRSASAASRESDSSSEQPSPTALDAPPSFTGPVYSAADREVDPPRLLSPEIPEWLIAGFGSRTNAVELLISERGVVESVRMVGNPQRLPDVMLLSRTKALEFDPARRYSQPVRYRLIFTWKVAP